jgi:Ni/Co efflux regulator RcnB
LAAPPVIAAQSDQQEDRADRREDRRDRREDRRDEAEDRRDRREDRRDTNPGDREDVRDQREDVRDAREDVRDEREDVRDRREDRRDARDGDRDRRDGVRVRIVDRPDVIRLRGVIRAPKRFRVAGYVRPRGFIVKRWAINDRLPLAFYARNYWLLNFTAYGLMAPPVGLVWVRVGNDAVLIDPDTGIVVRVVYDLFY